MANKQRMEGFQKNKEKCAALLQKYQKYSEEHRISSSLTKFPEVSSGELARRRRENRHIRAYHAQTFDYMMENIMEYHCAFALFDKDGCLIRLKGDEGVMRWLEQKGIRLGSMWMLNKIGSNAVSVGLKEFSTMVSVGEENYQGVLKDMAIYFSPLNLNMEEKTLKFGGIAIFVPKEKQDEAYLLNTTCLASCLMIRISMAYRTSDSYQIDSKGMVLLDINRVNGSVTMTHHNQALFDILGVPRQSYQEIYFKAAEEFFDPLPDNARFWEIINGQEEVKDYDITLQVRGKKIDCIISTKPHNQANIKSKGTLLSITTRQQISREVSEKTSNNAILSFEDIVGQSNIIRARIQKAKLFATTDSNVMLMGESGVGKDIFAQAIHNMSKRRGKPFIAVNCGALPRDLIASELFGYEGGAFTGAKKQGNIGKFELANGGTLFLDEIGELPLDLQATLLRAVEQKSFMRLGSSKLIHADIKIISATNANIQQMIEEKKFRADLFYRLGTMQLYIPPLRDRGDDVILLAEHFMRRIAQRTGRTDDVRLSEDAKEFLRACPWQGNVRELQNVMDCIVQLYPDTVITREHLIDNVNPAYLTLMGIAAPSESMYGGMVRPLYGGEYPVGGERPAASPEGGATYDRPVPPRQSLRTVLVTKEELMEAIAFCRGNRSEAARYLGIGRKTLYRYIEKYNLKDMI